MFMGLLNLTSFWIVTPFRCSFPRLARMQSNVGLIERFTNNDIGGTTNSRRNKKFDYKSLFNNNMWIFNLQQFGLLLKKYKLVNNTGLPKFKVGLIEVLCSSSYVQMVK